MPITDITKKLRKIRRYLTGFGIPSARNNKEIVFEINGSHFRTRSFYQVKRIVAKELGK